ncbi:DNA polymerase III subunit gamma/tau [Magnetospira thiophila]
MSDLAPPAAPQPAAGEYRVLARKYRPTDFSGLIGQQALVRTLTNAIESGRLAHAFILTGVRGIGKTTTARIIARALNCIGPDGKGGATITPCGVCPNCRAIAEDRHVDVLEMDAASRTGVDDIREIIEGVAYRPTSARFKIYIIDEVHMLSRNAFNALLKTLEEPPEHVKFIFATTEIRKVPVTVLSRCQRFDLRRVEMQTLITHFAAIADNEKVTIDPAALGLIARAADGSVRDGLSLLDQAIAHCAGTVSEAQVRDMLGLADRAVTFDLLTAVLRGDPAAALGILDTQYKSGAEPTVVLEDMLDLTHWLTRIKVVPKAAEGSTVSEIERTRGREMADGLGLATLARAWQMLLKGIQETRAAPSPFQATEMILIRLAHASTLPTPEEALKTAGGGTVPPGGGGGGTSSPTPAPSAMGSSAPPSRAPSTAPRAALALVAGDPQAETTLSPELPDPQTYDAVVALAEAEREAILHADLINNVHLVSFAPGRMEFRPGDHAPADLANKLKRFLDEKTSRRWAVTVSQRDPGAATLRQQQDAETAHLRARVAEHPMVRAMLDTFPGAEIAAVRAPAPPALGASSEPDEDE